MIDCNKCRKLFKNALNDELMKSQKELFESHLMNCTDCADEFAELQNTVSTMIRYKTYKGGEEFLETLWNKVEPQIRSRKRDHNKPGIEERLIGYLTLRSRFMQQLAGAVSILIVGVFLGRYFFVDSELSSYTINPGDRLVSEQTLALQAKADSYIESSKVLLLGLTNFDPKFDDIESISLGHQKNISRRLLSDAAELKAGLNKPSQAHLKQLVSDLELILLQIANLETEYDLSGIELVKEGVDRRGIFLKINIREMQRNKINSTQPASEKKKENNNI